MSKATIKSIAHDLNLSRNTVSMAFKDDPRVSSETRRKIFRHAASVGYTKFSPDNESSYFPESSLRILILRRPDQTVYWDRVINGVSEEAAANNCILNIAVVTQENIDTLQLPSGYTDEIDACLFLHKFSHAYESKILSKGKIGIFLDRRSYTFMEPVLGDVIISEGRRSTMELTLSLIRQGMSRIAFLCPYYINAETFCDRYEGYCSALAQAQIPVRPEYVITASPHKDKSYAMDAALEQFSANWPEAIVCASDECASRASERLLRQGLRIPEDIAITGFDNDEIDSFQPFFTTVDSNANQLGRRMVQQLLWRVAHPESPFETIMISGKVIYRKSSQKNI